MGCRLNCWGLVSRQNVSHWHTSEENIESHFVLERLEMLSFSIHKPAFILLDNASIHIAKIIKARSPIWQKRGLYWFYLPANSPHLNIAETIWRHLKGGWLGPQDYCDDQTLAYAVNRCLANVGKHLKINFSPFNTK
jgi:transposase